MCCLTIRACLVRTEKPKMNLGKVKDIAVMVGQEIHLVVPFSASPKPTAVWGVNGADLDLSPRVSQKVISNVLIVSPL